MKVEHYKFRRAWLLRTIDLGEDALDFDSTDLVMLTTQEGV